MRDVLDCLPIFQQIQYCIIGMVFRCALRCAPSYLCDLCCPVSVLAARRVLHSAKSQFISFLFFLLPFFVPRIAAFRFLQPFPSIPLHLRFLTSSPLFLLYFNTIFSHLLVSQSYSFSPQIIAFGLQWFVNCVGHGPLLLHGLSQRPKSFNCRHYDIYASLCGSFRVRIMVSVVIRDI